MRSGGAVGAGLGSESWALPGQPTGCSEAHGVGRSGLDLSAGDSGRAVGSSHCRSQHLAQVLLSVHKSLGLIRATAGTGRC